MVVDALLKANDHLGISSSIHQPAEYWKVWTLHVIRVWLGLLSSTLFNNTIYLKLQLDDSILRTIETAPDQELKESRDLIQRIRRRELYQVS